MPFDPDGKPPDIVIPRMAMHDLRSFIMWWGQRYNIPSPAAVRVLEALAQDLEDAIFRERGIRVDDVKVVIQDFVPRPAKT